MITLRRAMNAKQIITKFRFYKKFKKKKKKRSQNAYQKISDFDYLNMRLQ